MPLRDQGIAGLNFCASISATSSTGPRDDAGECPHPDKSSRKNVARQVRGMGARQPAGGRSACSTAGRASTRADGRGQSHDDLAAADGTPAADGVKTLQSEANGIHHLMAGNPQFGSARWRSICCRKVIVGLAPRVCSSAGTAGGGAGGASPSRLASTHSPRLTGDVLPG